MTNHDGAPVHPAEDGLVLSALGVRDGVLRLPARELLPVRVAPLPAEDPWSGAPPIPRVVPLDAGGAEELVGLAERSEVGLVLAADSSDPGAETPDIGAVWRVLRERPGAAVVRVPPPRGDWLDGYAAVQEALASQLRFPGRHPIHGKVAVVGVRNELNPFDNEANINELRRLLSLLGVDLVSVWTAGGPLSDLRRAQEAGTIISLPYGRAAARTLARRLRRRLVETELPFGLHATLRFLYDIGIAFSRRETADAVAQRELAETLERLERLSGAELGAARIGYVGDPHLLPGFLETTSLLGAECALALVTARAAHAAELLTGGPQGRRGGLAPAVRRALGCTPGGRRRVRPPECCTVAPTRAQVAATIDAATADGLLDGLVCDGSVAENADILRVPTLRFGFGTERRATMQARPTLGVRGMWAFVDALATALRSGRRAP